MMTLRIACPHKAQACCMRHAAMSWISIPMHPPRIPTMFLGGGGKRPYILTFHAWHKITLQSQVRIFFSIIFYVCLIFVATSVNGSSPVVAYFCHTSTLNSNHSRSSVSRLLELTRPCRGQGCLASG
ncbi:hypothetical protein M405DRAFT_181401 [Rhizopogon salebrosus TDB-379]|nr:hypothetical protein M405DRAFT_181401 [Rhizopogon salebrosus TDB-379]